VTRHRIRAVLDWDLRVLRRRMLDLGRDRAHEVTEDVRRRLIDAERAALTTSETIAMLAAA